MSYRDDPAWQNAQADYLAELPDVTPDDRFTGRIEAAWRMREIERQHATPTP